MNTHCPIDGGGELENAPFASSAAKRFRYDDLEQFSKQFDGLELECIQLSPGRFDGNVVFAPMDAASIHISQCVQALEMRMKVNPDRYLVCVSLGEDSGVPVFGAQDPGSWIFLLPPGGSVAKPVPESCTLVTMSITSDAILESASLRPEARNWFSNLLPEGAFLRSKHLASRVREDVALALSGNESSPENGAREPGGSVCEAMISGILSAFSLEWLTQSGFKVDRHTTASNRFFQARCLICEHDFKNGEALKTALSGLGSARSVEQAFSSHLKMGPHAYARAIRLHNARRKLQDRRHAGESVADIAAKEGFPDCSRFALYYRKHFGEQPSKTRKKALVGQGSPDFALSFKRLRR